MKEGVAKPIEIQVAYAIGVAQPVAILVTPSAQATSQRRARSSPDFGFAAASSSEWTYPSDLPPTRTTATSVVRDCRGGRLGVSSCNPSSSFRPPAQCFGDRETVVEAATNLLRP